MPSEEIISEKWSTNWVVRHTLKIFGRPFDGPAHFRMLFLVFSYILLGVVLIVGQFLPWKEPSARLLPLEDLNITLFGVLVQYELLTAIDRVKKVIDIKEENTLNHPLKMSQAQKDILIKSKKTDKIVALRIVSACVGYTLTGALFPGIQGLYKINFENVEELDENEITMPYLGWLPFSIKTNRNMIPVLIFQITLQFFISLTFIAFFLMVLSSLLSIADDLKILTIFVREIDEKIQSGEIIDSDVSDDEKSMSLKEYMSWIIEYHNAIIRSVDSFNKNTTLTMLVCNQMFVVELCIPLFYVLEVDNNNLRGQFLSLLVIDSTVFIYFGSFGQLIIDESDNFCTALEFTSWPDKPKWFKKCLSIMISASQRPLQIKPAGLYTLNMNNIMSIVNAGYSYLNLMRTVKHK